MREPGRLTQTSLLRPTKYPFARPRVCTFILKNMAAYRPYSRIYKGPKPTLEHKNPYVVIGQPGMIKYLTDKQASGRDDLIPQFQR